MAKWSVMSTDHSYVRPALLSGSRALNVASVPSWFSSTVSALSFTVTPPVATNEMSAGSSTSSTVTVTAMLPVSPSLSRALTVMS
jgi:hypothetical protein